jgi:vancomycin aglycone glucosyltransferase
MRVLSAYGSRGDVEPLVGLAVRLRALGAEVRVCAPGSTSGGALLVMATGFVTPVQAPCCAQWLQVTSDRS